MWSWLRRHFLQDTDCWNPSATIILNLWHNLQTVRSKPRISVLRAVMSFSPWNWLGQASGSCARPPGQGSQYLTCEVNTFCRLCVASFWGDSPCAGITGAEGAVMINENVASPCPNSQDGGRWKNSVRKAVKQNIKVSTGLKYTSGRQGGGLWWGGLICFYLQVSFQKVMFAASCRTSWCRGGDMPHEAGGGLPRQNPREEMFCQSSRLW